MAEGLAIVAIVISLLCIGMAVWLGCQLFRLTLKHEALAAKLQDGFSRIIGDYLWLKKDVAAIQEEAKNGVDTGMYTPVQDKLTGKVEWKQVDNLGNLEGLSFDDIMKQAQALADGKAPNGRT